MKKEISEAATFCEIVEINYSKDGLIKLIFWKPNKFQMDFTLAPRILNEE